MVRTIRYPYSGVVILCVVGSVLAGCSALRRPDPVINRSEDPRIASEVRQRLAVEPSLDSQLLRVEVDGGVVVLYGAVEGMASWRCAIRTAQMVAGVTTVVDYLVIGRGPTTGPCQGRPGPGPASTGLQTAPSRD